MSAKFLNVFEDESPDMHKQFGCISGLFQVFDRHHLLARRRFGGGNSQKGIPSGNLSSDVNGCSPKTVLMKNPSHNENHRTSEESSRTSFSSSSCSSSFSSVEGNQSAQTESSVFDFRDIVKESIYRESHGLSVKTEAPKGGKKVVVKNKDSPRPLPLSRLTDSLNVVNRKSQASVDLDESLCVLAKLKQGPWNLSEPKESPRTSFESKPAVASRFSCDGREVSRASFDSRECKIFSKIKETPRFSLDSRQTSLKEAERRDSNQRILKALSLHQDLGSNVNSPSVVARLMGLEAMTTHGRVCDGNEDSQRRSSSFSRSPRVAEECKQDQKQQEKSQVPSKKQESVYSDIAKKLNELEFQQSNKDLRALKHILDAIKAKGLLESKKCEQKPSQISHQKMSDNPNVIARDRSSIPVDRKLRDNGRIHLDSPIVIIKPVKSANNSSPPATTKSFEGLVGLRKVRTGDAIESKSASGNNRQLQDQSPRRQKSPREVNAKSSNSSLSPRMQQKRLALERKSQSEVKNQRRQTRQSSEVDSPRAKLRVKARAEQILDGRLCRNSSPQDDEISQRSDSNISLASQGDVEATSMDRSPKLDFSLFHGIQSPSTIAVGCSGSFIKHKKGLGHFGEDCASSERVATGNEQPSPVSVLNPSFYRDESPASPVDGSSISCGDEEYRNAREVDLKNIQNITSLVQKLEHLRSTDDEFQEDQVALLCDTPNNQYIMEVLQASGILRMDLSNGIQLRNTSCLINPELFLVLEQKISGHQILQSVPRDVTFESKSKIEKTKRKLIFDMINELLAEKLDISRPWPQLASCVRAGRIVCAAPSSQHLLEELCSEIGQLDTLVSQASGPALEDEEDNGLKLRLCHDIARQSEGWSGNGREMSALVLDIERSIFKDMIDEVVSGEAALFLQARSCRRRQLFVK